MALKYVKRYASLFRIRAVKSKTILKYPWYWQNFKNLKIHSVGKIVGKQAFLYIPVGKTIWNHLDAAKKITWAFIFQPGNPNSWSLSRRYIPNTTKIYIHRVFHWSIIHSCKILEITKTSKLRWLIE